MISAKTAKAFRGIAILIVIASHYAGWMYVEALHPLAQARIATWGPPGVDIFLLFSGYGLYKSAERGRQRALSRAEEALRFSNRSGITGQFLLRRLLGAVVPYYLIAGLINCYTGAWAQAAADGTMRQTLYAYLTAADYWYMQVLFVLYAAFLLCFRFGGYARVPLLTAAVVAYTVRLFNTGHADFWELSNMAFLIGVVAAGAERLFARVLREKTTALAIGVTALLGMLYTYGGMERHGGSGAAESFGWELAMNLCFTIVSLCAAWCIPAWKGRLLPALGEASLFVYLLHTVLFWALIFQLEPLGYAAAASLVGAVTLIVSTAAGLLYQRLSARITARI